MNVNRQYVGARYVPIFYQNSVNPNTSLWEQNVDYEPLVWVSLSNGNMYLSKKSVPASVGSPADNPEYWLTAGQFNAYIEQLQEEIDDINDDISLINKKIKKRYIFIGDSYAHASGTNAGWVDKIVPILKLSSNDYFSAGVGGAGFATSPVNFLSMIQGLYADIDDPTSITDIVVLGGANDLARNETDVSNAIASFNNYCSTMFVNAKVRIGMIAGSKDPTRIGIQYDRVLRGYVNCGNAEFLNNLQYVLHNYSLIGNDGIHPTNQGYNVLAEKIVEALNGGCSVNYYSHDDLIVPDGYTHAIQSEVAVNVNNNITNISFGRRFGISASASSAYFAIASGVSKLIGTIPSDYVIGVQNTNYDAWQFNRAKCSALVHSTISDLYYTIDGMIEIYNKNIYFVSYDAILGTTGAFSSCDSIQIMSDNIIGNTMFF